MNPYAIIVACALLLGAYASGRWQQYRSDQAEETARELKQTQEARQKESEWSESIARITYEKDADLSRIASERDAALHSLRDRTAKRLSETPKVCSGASPAALSAEDAAVAIRLATEADELRARYKEAIDYIEAISTLSSK